MTVTQRMNSGRGAETEVGLLLVPRRIWKCFTQKKKPAANGVRERWELLGGYETLIRFPEASISSPFSVPLESRWRAFYCSSSFSWWKRGWTGMCPSGKMSFQGTTMDAEDPIASTTYSSAALTLFFGKAAQRLQKPGLTNIYGLFCIEVW